VFQHQDPFLMAVFEEEPATSLDLGYYWVQVCAVGAMYNEASAVLEPAKKWPQEELAAVHLDEAHKAMVGTPDRSDNTCFVDDRTSDVHGHHAEIEQKQERPTEAYTLTDTVGSSLRSP
jgi:hypothetical protein